MEYEFQIARKILHCWQEYVAKDTRPSDDSRWIDKMEDIGFLFNFEEITIKTPYPILPEPGLIWNGGAWEVNPK